MEITELLGLPKVPLVKPTLEYPDPGLVMMYKQLGKRVIWLDEEVNWDTCAFLIQYIQYLNRDEADDLTPIELHMMTNGGELPTMFTIYDTIKNSKIPVHTINEGACHSAGFIIYLAGHIRSMNENATFIAHEGSGGMGGSYRENKSAMEQYEKDVLHMKEIIVAETNFTMEELDAAFEKSQDFYINKALATEKGVVKGV